MRVAVVGAGGVGGYFGGRLAQAGVDVRFIARGRHLEALRRDGLQVESVKGDFALPVFVSADPADVGPSDIVLFCVKSYDTETAAARLRPLLHNETAVVSLQNGVDNEDKLIKEIGEQYVMGGAAYIFAGIKQPGLVLHTGGPTSIVFGELDGRESTRSKSLLAACRSAGFGAEISPDILTVKWAKLAFICALAGMTATSRLPVGDIRSTPESWQGLRRIFDETCAVAAAAGRPVPVTVQNRMLETAQGLEPGSFSSLHDDLVHGRRMELETLHGFVVRAAAEHRLPVPMSDAVYAILKPWAMLNDRGRS